MWQASTNRSDMYSTPLNGGNDSGHNHNLLEWKHVKIRFPKPLFLFDDVSDRAANRFSLVEQRVQQQQDQQHKFRRRRIERNFLLRLNLKFTGLHLAQYWQISAGRFSLQNTSSLHFLRF